jgi:hypothetical protein
MALSSAEVATLPRARRAMRRVERAIQTRFLLFLLLVALYLAITETVKTGLDGYIDWLYISTIALFALGLSLAVRLPARMERTIIRLAARGSLNLPDEEATGFLLAFEKRSARWALIGGVLGALAILSAYIFTGSLGVASSPVRVAINGAAPVIETCIGFFIGYYAGYAASNGLLGRFLKRHGVALHAQPGHLDGVAGFRPVGSFYFSQAAILGLAALFLVVWWALIGLSPELAKHNGAWRTPYLVFFFVVILAEMLAFALPLWSFHVELEAQRRNLLLLADKLSQRIAALQTQLVMDPSSEKAQELKEQQLALTEYYWAIQRMPTWPISTGVWWRLLLSTLGLLAPLAAQLAIERLPVFAFLR